MMENTKCGAHLPFEHAQNQQKCALLNVMEEIHETYLQVPLPTSNPRKIPKAEFFWMDSIQ